MYRAIVMGLLRGRTFIACFGHAAIMNAIKTLQLG